MEDEVCYPEIALDALLHVSFVLCKTHFFKSNFAFLNKQADQKQKINKYI